MTEREWRRTMWTRYAVAECYHKNKIANSTVVYSTRICNHGIALTRDSVILRSAVRINFITNIHFPKPRCLFDTHSLICQQVFFGNVLSSNLGQVMSDSNLFHMNISTTFVRFFVYCVFHVLYLCEIQDSGTFGCLCTQIWDFFLMRVDCLALFQTFSRYEWAWSQCCGFWEFSVMNGLLLHVSFGDSRHTTQTQWYLRCCFSSWGKQSMLAGILERPVLLCFVFWSKFVTPITECYLRVQRKISFTEPGSFISVSAVQCLDLLAWVSEFQVCVWMRARLGWKLDHPEFCEGMQEMARLGTRFEVSGIRFASHDIGYNTTHSSY